MLEYVCQELLLLYTVDMKFCTIIFQVEQLQALWRTTQLQSVDTVGPVTPDDDISLYRLFGFGTLSAFDSENVLSSGAY